MKKVFFMWFALVQVLTYAQQTPSAKSLYDQGLHYLNGMGKPYDPEKAKLLFWQSAAMQNSQAMNALGNMYLKGIAMAMNADSAICWYNKSASLGYTKAFNNLGKLYKTGSGVLQDFVKAVSYFKKGAALNDLECKVSLAYMFYKGFGVSQNYYSAFNLYKQTAELGDINSMYFLGLCYRNGYGTSLNIELAKEWLAKAAKKQNVQAIHELNEELLPENLSTISSKLEDQLAALKTYKEKFQAESSNNYGGTYKGFAIYYDWSGKYVTEIIPLQLSLIKTISGYKGSWKEGDNSTASINFQVSKNTFSFSKDNEYTRSDHYSDRRVERWQFNQASLKLNFIGDSVELNGYVQFFSPKRREPGKPLQIILKKGISEEDLSGENKISLFPNPATDKTLVLISLIRKAQVSIKVTAQSGSAVFIESGKVLPPGTYTYPLYVTGFAKGTYNIDLIVNGKIVTTKQLIKL